MSRIVRIIALLALLVLVAAACGEDEADVAEEAPPTDEEEAPDEPVDEEEPPEEPADEEPEEEPADPAEEEATVAVTSTDFGDVLGDGEGMTLYMFDPDDQGESTCYDECEQNWPPLVVDGDPVAGDGVDEGLLGTTERDDGSMQVTYDDWPLYHWAGDDAPGDTNGQGVQDVWWVIDADGTPLRDAEEDNDTAGGGAGY